MHRIFPIMLCVSLVLPIAAAAQDAPGPMTWLAFSQLADGKSGRDGVINGYGNAVPANHRPDDDANFMEWVSVNDW